MKHLASCLLVFAMLPAVAMADIYVVASVNSPLTQITARDLQHIYMGRRRALVGAEETRPIDQPALSPLREAFYKSITGMNLSQINSYWARLLFTGQTIPPSVETSEAAVLNRLKQDPKALGYVEVRPTDSQFKVLLVLKDGGG